MIYLLSALADLIGEPITQPYLPAEAAGDGQADQVGLSGE